MGKATAKFEFFWPGLQRVVFTQHEVNKHSSQWNIGKKPAEFGTDDFNEAVGDLLFERLGEEHHEFVEKTLDNATIGRHVRRF